MFTIKKSMSCKVDDLISTKVRTDGSFTTRIKALCDHRRAPGRNPKDRFIRVGCVCKSLKRPIAHKNARSFGETLVVTIVGGCLCHSRSIWTRPYTVVTDTENRISYHSDKFARRGRTITCRAHCDKRRDRWQYNHFIRFQ